MQQFFDSLLVSFGSGVTDIIVALLILIVGWIFARLVGGAVRKLLRRTDLDNRLAQATVGSDEAAIKAEDWIAKGVFYLIMVFVLIAFFQRLQLTAVTEPLNAMLNTIMGYLPQLVGAGVLLLVAWIVATVVKTLVSRGATMFKLDERLSAQGALEEGEQVSVSASLATAAYWLIFLLFLPAILDALEMQGLMEPVQGMLAQIMSFIPNIFAAAIILLIGWFVARIVRQIVSNLLAAAGTNRLGERIGLGRQTTLSGLVGTIVYAFILIPAIISALEALKIEAISGPATAMLSAILNAVPPIFGAAVVLGISYLVGKLVSGLIVDILSGLGVDSWPAKVGIKLHSKRTLSEIVGYILLIAIMLFASMEAAEMLGFDKFSELVNEFILFGGRILLAIIIFGIGFYVANWARDIMLSTMGEDAAFIASLARAAILVLVSAMALNQMGIAQDIVNNAFTILLAAIGIAAALAFGLGSREIAGKEVARWLDSTRKK